MRIKTLSATVHAAATGSFQALVAVYGNVDSDGDRILHGAFAQTLAEWRKSGDPIPVILSHRHDDVDSHIGGIVKAEDAIETERGLVVRGMLDVADNPVARQVHKLMKRRSLREFSFGYRVPKGGEAKAADGVNEIRTLDLIELGPTLKGSNPDTLLLGVKSLDSPPSHAELRERCVEIDLGIPLLQRRARDVADALLLDG